MCSDFESYHPWPGAVPAASLNGTRVGLLHGKNLPNIAGIMAAAYPGASRGLKASTPPAAPIRQEPFRQINSTFRNRLANPAAYMTMGLPTVAGVGAPERPQNFDIQLEADAYADSEAESDTSQSSDSESEDIEGTEDVDDYEEHRFGNGGKISWVDGDNDTNMEPPSSPAFAQASAYAAITNPNKKPRRCKLSRKHYGLSGTRRSMNSPDIDMDPPAEEDPDDYYNDSSADEDTDRYAYSTWFGGIYHPMWLGHATSSGKKRRDNSLDEGARDGREGKAVEVGAVAELGKRHIRLPSLSHRKRAWKASQGTQSSVGESEWSLTVNNPMPLPSGSTAGVMSSPPMSPSPITATKQMHTASRSTQPRHRQSPARALERRLENLRVEDPGRGTTTAAAVVAANDLRPRMPSDQHEKKRIRYQQTTPTSMEATVLEEPMGCRFSGVDGQMSGIEMNMGSPMGGMMLAGVSETERAKDISRVMEGVDDLL